jgi:hypothetical protein
VNCVPANQLNDTVDLLGKHHLRHLCCDKSIAVDQNSGFFADYEDVDPEKLEKKSI